jgi:hypothetical protein
MQVKRDTIILALAVAQAALFLVTGLLPVTKVHHLNALLEEAGAPWLLKALGGFLWFGGVALLWSAHRGVVDAPLRLLVCGMSLILGALFLGAAWTYGPIIGSMLFGVMHMVAAVGWITLLLSSNSPYHPRSVASSKRMKQRM